MQAIKIRESVESDKSSLIKLFFEFGEFLKKTDEKYLNMLLVPEDYGQRYYKMMIDDVEKKQGKIYVVEDSERLVGFIAGVILEVGNNEEEFDFKPHRMGRVIELFLEEKYRGMGLGSVLIKKMEEYFKENKCYKINIEVFAPNVNSYKFYKKHGYTDRNNDVVKVI